MEATEYGLSNLITSLSKKDRKKQWRSVKGYLSDQYVFIYLRRDLSSCVIRIMHVVV